MTDKPHDILKAFKSQHFLGSADARPLRILAEYLEPRARFEHYRIDDTIVFFGSARIVARKEAEKELAAA
ncbi:MAG: lysine decarboxylase, partial [Rhodospirillales bacterium]|nr:lysine decarboxylase [Rhodospirillales bacterium]